MSTTQRLKELARMTIVKAADELNGSKLTNDFCIENVRRWFPGQVADIEGDCFLDAFRASLSSVNRENAGSLEGYQLFLPLSDASGNEIKWVLPRTFALRDDESIGRKLALETTLGETEQAIESIRQDNMEKVQSKFLLDKKAIDFALDLPGITRESTWSDVFSIMRKASEQ